MNYNSQKSKKYATEKLYVITNSSERVPIGISRYGSNTPEDVFVEFIQAIFDNDAERLMHTLSHFSWILFWLYLLIQKIIKKLWIVLITMKQLNGEFYQESAKFGNR